MPGIYHPGPSGSTVAIVPADADIAGGLVRSLYVGGTGNVTVVDADGNTTLFSAVPAGFILPVVCKQVKATGTTATLIVGLR